MKIQTDADVVIFMRDVSETQWESAKKEGQLQTAKNEENFKEIFRDLEWSRKFRGDCESSWSFFPIEIMVIYRNLSIK